MHNRLDNVVSMHNEFQLEIDMYVCICKVYIDIFCPQTTVIRKKYVISLEKVYNSEMKYDLHQAAEGWIFKKWI